MSNFFDNGAIIAPKNYFRVIRKYDCRVRDIAKVSSSCKAELDVLKHKRIHNRTEFDKQKMSELDSIILNNIKKEAALASLKGAMFNAITELDEALNINS